LQAISQLQPQPPAKLAQIAGAGWPSRAKTGSGCAIFGQCEQSELAGLARYYYGLSQLPLQELTLKRGRHGWSVRQQESLSPLALSPSEKALMVQHAQALVGTGDEEQAAPLPARHPGRPQRRPRQQRCPGAGAFIKAAAAQDPGRDPAPLGHRAVAGVRHPLAAPRPRSATTPSNLPAVPSSSRCRSSTVRAILACSKQAYLYELMVRSGVPMPPPPS
jgi:hypothetical protein